MEVNAMPLNIYVIHKFSQEGKIANNRMLNPSYGCFNFHYEKYYLLKMEAITVAILNADKCRKFKHEK